MKFRSQNVPSVKWSKLTDNQLVDKNDLLTQSHLQYITIADES